MATKQTGLQGYLILVEQFEKSVERAKKLALHRYSTNKPGRMTKQEDLPEILEGIAQRAESLADQARGFKTVVQTGFSENDVLSKEHWQEIALIITGNMVIFGDWAKLDTKEISDFIVEQINDQANK